MVYLDFTHKIHKPPPNEGASNHKYIFMSMTGPFSHGVTNQVIIIDSTHERVGIHTKAKQKDQIDATETQNDSR